MAEALLRRELGDITVESAGLGALVGYPASEYSRELMAEVDIDISSHRARQIHPDMVAEADLVLVMELRHKRAIDDADATARGKVHRLGEWQNRDIADPYRKERSAYETAFADIREGVTSWVEKIRA